jgi:hypothetical protein
LGWVWASKAASRSWRGQTSQVNIIVWTVVVGRVGYRWWLLVDLIKE